MKESNILTKEILRKIYPALNEAESHQIVLLPRQKNLMQFLYYYSQKQLDYVLSQMNNFDCWYKQQTLTDDLRNNFCKNAGWTLDETTSIILRKNPKAINLKSLIQRLEEIFKIRSLSYEDRKNLEDYILDYPIINDYNEQLKQIDLAIDFKEITDIKLLYDEHNNYVRIIPPQKVLKWCKEKEIKLPDGIEELIEKYHDYQDKEIKYQKLEAENQKLMIESQELHTKIDNLNKNYEILLQDKPNTKILNSYKQLAMGMLAVHYGEEQVKIWEDWTNEAVLNKSSIKQKELLFTRIEEDLAKLNASGIKIKRDAIRDKIKESINLLKVKKI